MKKYWFCERPAIMAEAAKAERKFHPVLVVALFLIVPWVVNLLFFLATVPLIDLLGYDKYSALPLDNIAPIISAALIVLFVRFAEKRSWASMGVVNNNALKIYLIVLGILFVLNVLFGFVRPEGMQEGSLLTALQFASQAAASLCGAIMSYGFFAVSLANRMSMKGTVITVVLLSLAIYVLQMINTVLFYTQIYVPEMEGPSFAAEITRIALTAVVTTIFMVTCALLLFRTGHIWGVAILAFVKTGIKDLGLMPDYPYHSIIMIILSAAVLCMVLFIPKKGQGADNDLTEGAGFVSR